MNMGHTHFPLQTNNQRVWCQAAKGYHLGITAAGQMMFASWGTLNGSSLVKASENPCFPHVCFDLHRVQYHLGMGQNLLIMWYKGWPTTLRFTGGTGFWPSSILVLTMQVLWIEGYPVAWPMPNCWFLANFWEGPSPVDPGVPPRSCAIQNSWNCPAHSCLLFYSFIT